MPLNKETKPNQTVHPHKMLVHCNSKFVTPPYGVACWLNEKNNP